MKIYTHNITMDDFPQMKFDFVSTNINQRELCWDLSDKNYLGVYSTKRISFLRGESKVGYITFNALHRIVLIDENEEPLSQQLAEVYGEAKVSFLIPDKPGIISSDSGYITPTDWGNYHEVRISGWSFEDFKFEKVIG